MRANRHLLDWPNQPLPFKIYTSLEPIGLTRELPASDVPALQAIAGDVETRDVPLDRDLLARACYFANGMTKIIRYSGGEMAFRAAACTGALYHIELYLVGGPLADLEAGVYHYAAHDHSLRRVRAGDFRRVLVEAAGAEPAIAHAPVVVVCTSTFWRNAWKYQARAYRHSFWDTGTILANLFAVAAAHRLPARLVQGFADASVNRLLDVDSGHEAAVCLVALGAQTDEAPPAPSVEPLDLPTRRLSPTEVDYPSIVEMHAASSLESTEEAAAWRVPGELPATPTPLPSTRPIEDVIRRRGSSRQFTREPIELQQLTTMLEVATRPIPSDLAGLGRLSQPYLIANAVDGLPSGTYAFDRELVPLKSGSFRDQAGFLDLGQALAADAAVSVYSLADLHAILPRLGNRGYRAAQLEAAIEGGKLYLAAYALGFGATGLTFFDDDVTRFFSPHAANKSVMFLTAIGHPARRR